jgi:hypothetical protein
MTRNVPAAEFKQVHGSIRALLLIIAMSPVFLLLAFLYVLMHPNRADPNPEGRPASELLPTN